MKRKDIKPCAQCGEGVMACEAISFYRIKIEHCVLNLQAIQRESAMETVMHGSPLLASVLGPNEDIAAVASGGEIWICQACATTYPVLVAVLHDGVGEKDEG